MLHRLWISLHIFITLPAILAVQLPKWDNQGGASNKGPSSWSTNHALHVQRQYSLHPPHDPLLYQLLQVPSNATSDQISKSYRRLSRQYHPDKQTTKPLSAQQASSQILEQIQQAYEILNNDKTRLPYHRYGLTDPKIIVSLLLGRPSHQTGHPSSHDDLLQLIGYTDRTLDHPSFRLHTITAHLVERLRPLVEGTVPPALVAHQLMQDCDRWKHLPMGAQILRCVGRAYRHAGQDYLGRQRAVQHHWRTVKALGTALWATGRATMYDFWTPKARPFSSSTLSNHSGEDSDQSDNDMDNLQLIQHHHEDTDHSLRETRRRQAQETLLSTLQMDALWKVAKIDLDRTIRKACQMILRGDLLLPSYYYEYHPSNNMIPPQLEYGESAWSSSATSQAWVTPSGHVLHKEEALQRAAEGMIFLGNIMVERSKVGTSWR